MLVVSLDGVTSATLCSLFKSVEMPVAWISGDLSWGIYFPSWFDNFVCERIKFVLRSGKKDNFVLCGELLSNGEPETGANTSNDCNRYQLGWEMYWSRTFSHCKMWRNG
jgi:hypothetical protein